MSRISHTFFSLAGAAIIVALLASGAAHANTVVTISGYTGQTQGPTPSGTNLDVTTELNSVGPGTFKVRDAKTGRLADTGTMDTQSGSLTRGPTVGTSVLPPGDYVVEIWQQDPRGTSFKGEHKFTVGPNEGFKGVSPTELTPQTPSEVAMDEVDTIQDGIDSLRYDHAHALDAAANSETQEEMDNATGYASEVLEKLLELIDKKADKHLEANRLATEEAAAAAEEGIQPAAPSPDPKSDRECKGGGLLGNMECVGKRFGGD